MLLAERACQPHAACYYCCCSKPCQAPHLQEHRVYHIGYTTQGHTQDLQCRLANTHFCSVDSTRSTTHNCCEVAKAQQPICSKQAVPSNHSNPQPSWFRIAVHPAWHALVLRQSTLHPTGRGGGLQVPAVGTPLRHLMHCATSIYCSPSTVATCHMDTIPSPKILWRIRPALS